MSLQRPGRPTPFSSSRVFVGVVGLLPLFAVVFLVDVAADHLVLDALHVSVAGLNLVHDLPVLEDVDAVGELDHLVQPVRDEDEGRARAAVRAPA